LDAGQGCGKVDGLKEVIHQDGLPWTGMIERKGKFIKKVKFRCRHDKQADD
jgi:hypothetical protein